MATNCSVERVLTEDGEVSYLYENLLNVTGDQSRALELYLTLSDTAFSADNLNSQGEPTMNAVVDSGLLRDYEVSRVQRGAIALNQSNIEDDVIRSLVSEIDEGITSLETLLNEGLDENQKTRIKDQISQLRDSRRKLSARKAGVSAVREVFEDHKQYLKSLSQRSDATTQQLLHGIRVTDLWDFENTSGYLSDAQVNSLDTDNPDPYAKVFLSASNQMEDLQQQLINHSQNTLLKEIKQEANIQQDVSLDDIRNLEDIGWIKEKLFNISHVDNPMIQYFNRTLLNAKRDADSSVAQLRDELSEILENNDVEPEDILQKDENGDPIPQLMSPYSSDYYDQRSSALSIYHSQMTKANEQSPEQAERTMRQAKKELYQQLNELETVVDPRILIEELDAPKGSPSREKYISTLVDAIGEENARFAIEQAQIKWQNYKQREEAYRRDYLLAEIRSGDWQQDRIDKEETQEQWRKRKMREFRKEYDPTVYLRDREDPNNIEFVRSKGYNYTYSVPNIENEEFYNEEFPDRGTPQRELWDRVTDALNEAKSFLPQEYTQRLDETFMPKVQKDLVERLRTIGIFDAGKRSISDFVEKIRATEQKSLLAEEDGDSVFDSPMERNRIPIKFLGQDNLDKVDMTTDVVKATQMFYAMALDYKNMTNVTPEAELIHRMVEEANVKENGQISSSNGGPQRLKNKVKREMDYLIANYSKKEEEGKSSFQLLSPTELENKRQDLNNRIQSLEEKFDNDEISEEVFNEEKQKLQERLDRLPESAGLLSSLNVTSKKKELERQAETVQRNWEEGEISKQQRDERLQELDQQYKDLGGKSLVWSSLIDNTALSYAQIKGMGLNLFASVRNLAYGLISNAIHAAGDQEFNDSHLMSAFSIMMKDITTGRGKVRALVDRFSILFEVTEVGYGKDRDFTGGWDVYFLQSTTEFFGQGLTMIATMLNTTVEDANGNERNLWQAFDDSGNWKTDEFGEPGEWDSRSDREDGEKFQNFRNKVVQLNGQLHGDYAKDSQQDLKRHILGRLVSMFRTWIPEMVAYRFGSTRNDAHLGREVTGIYRNTARALRDNKYGETLSYMLQSYVPYAQRFTDFGENISDEQKSAIRRTMREAQIFTGLAIAILALGGYDDEEEKSAQRKMLINNLIMLQQDIQLYTSPARAIDMMKNPIPATSVYLDYQRAMQSTYQFMIDEEYQGDHPAIKWMGAMPVVKQANTVRWSSERVLQ
jgi:hypothetical protein